MSHLSSLKLHARLRLGFAGTPEFAARILKRLLASNRAPAVVYTQPDQRAGRGRRMQPGAVKALALAHQLEIRQPVTWKYAEAVSELASFDLDVLVVAAYGLILPPSVLAVPRHGCINVHASVLPRWRGAAPIERAIMAGDETSGVSIMQMDEGLDTGAVFLTETLAIGADTTGWELEVALAELGAETLLRCLDELPKLSSEAQSEAGASYAHKITHNDAAIDWRGAATSIHRQIRALCGRVPARSYLDGCRVQVLTAETLETSGGTNPGEIVATSKAGIQVSCGQGSLLLKRLQLDKGKGQPLNASDAVNGFANLFSYGSRFSDEG